MTNRPILSRRVAHLIAALIVALAGASAGTVGSLYIFGAFTSEAEVVQHVLAPTAPKRPELNRAEYDRRMRLLAGLPGVASTTASTTATTTKKLWFENDPYPLGGALLPFKRIVAYYGNYYSTRMGILGEFPEDIMLARLTEAVGEWEAADPETPVIPAIHYIVVTAQASPQADGMHRLRMPDSQVDKSLALAEKVKGIVFLDFQVGHSDPLTELKQYENYLTLPNVHVGLDPEFAMADKSKPGKRIGTFDAEDINAATAYLATLVRGHDLPPKVLVVHRFTHDMLTNAREIHPLPEVQVVINMDGWGSPQKKIGTYTRVVAPEPVQFTGFKLFYKNDLRPPSTRLLTPAEILKLTPKPMYIQYQ